MFRRPLLTLAVIVFTLLLGGAQPVAEALSIVSGLSQPTDIACPTDGTNRLFITEKSGRIKIIRNKQVVGTFLDLSSKVSTTSERGLLGLAFHPDYAQNGYFYVNYTGPDINGQFFTIISRFQVSSSNADLADASSEQVILTFAQPFSNHNGGDLVFGPDGYLYIATGDGGSAGDPQNNSQNLGNLLGKILRININSNPEPYQIPADNPFTGQAGMRPEIWSYGLRNPWRIAFDKSTGDLWIADVGQGVWEEITIQPAGQGGQNYGWRCYEGLVAYTNCGSITHTAPQYVYAHPGSNCADTTFCGRSVTGGYVYRGQQYPALQGYYFFADYVDKRMWALKMNGQLPQVIRQSQIFIGGITTFGENEEGELFFATLSGGLYQLVSNQVLPVTVINYGLRSNKNKYELYWETFDEIDLDYYLVETSTDLESIQEVHREPALGHAKNTYLFEGLITTPLLYVRVTAVDLDGTREQLPWKTIQLPVTSPHWFPNPSSQFFLTTFSGALEGLLKVYDAQGQEVGHRINNFHGQTQLELTTPVPGIYFIHYQSIVGQKVQKVILQKL